MYWAIRLQSSVPDAKINSRWSALPSIVCSCMQIFLPHRLALMAWKRLKVRKAEISFNHPNLLTTLLSALNPFWRWINAPINTPRRWWYCELSSTTLFHWKTNVMLNTSKQKKKQTSLLSYRSALFPRGLAIWLGASHNSLAQNSLTHFFLPNFPSEDSCPCSYPAGTEGSNAGGHLFYYTSLSFPAFYSSKLNKSHKNNNRNNLRAVALALYCAVSKSSVQIEDTLYKSAAFKPNIVCRWI